MVLAAALLQVWVSGKGRAMMMLLVRNLELSVRRTRVKKYLMKVTDSETASMRVLVFDLLLSIVVHLLQIFS